MNDKTKLKMNFFKNLKNKFRKCLFCFHFDSICEINPIKYNPIYTIDIDDSGESDFDLNY